jgi:malate synthase
VIAEAPIPGVSLHFPAAAPGRELLSHDALEFICSLHRRFDPRRRALLEARRERQARLDRGEGLDFETATHEIRHDSWQIAPVPRDLLDRRVEITGPPDRKMVINALSSGAKVFMACFEDATAPTAANLLQGQVNLRDAIRGSISFEDPVSGRSYRLGPRRAVLKVRPRGWHLEEKHFRVDGRPVAGALFDFGLFLFHNAHELIARGSAPYFYLPKLEHYLEARLWDDVFIEAQRALGLPRGTIKATVLIETLPAAFHAEEILYELRQHMAGLNCGRWDYIFSHIKKRRADPAAVFPDRANVTMTTPFMRAYCLHVIRTCHRRGAHALGGMAAQIPVKDDPAANERAFAKVRADKEREVKDGHDGTWVAHPGLVPIAMEVFDGFMRTPNQVARQLDGVRVEARDLLAPHAEARTIEGLRTNVNVGVRYLAAWLRGQGAVPLHDLMEDAATAEISRAQLWQWRRHGALLADGRRVDRSLLEAELARELRDIELERGPSAFSEGRYREAAGLIEELILAEELPDFMTTIAYDRYFAPQP